MCAMEEVLDLYEQPYDEAHPVICLDESPRQLVSEVRTAPVDEDGNRYEDYEYKREGVADLFMIAEPKAGKRQVLVKPDHKSARWAEVIAHIAEQMHPQASHITIVEDNLSAHRSAALYEIFTPERARGILKRISFVHTPKHGSWLNIAELEFSVLTRVGLAHRIATVEELERQIAAYETYKNEQAKTVNWQFKTKEARIKLQHLYPTLDG